MTYTQKNSTALVQNAPLIHSQIHSTRTSGISGGFTLQNNQKQRNSTNFAAH